MLPSYSYSDITPYPGATGNAAANGNSWVMNNILPDPPGLEINGVIYNYTIQKNVDDSVKVHVQNENANGSGYIFRETDEWKSGSLGGTEIRKTVPVVPGVPRQAFGDGSIEVEGPGSVEDPNVIYTYRVDPCFDPQFDPSCPGYKPIIPDVPEVDPRTLYSALDDEAVVIATTETDSELYEEENEQVEPEEESEEREEMRLEAALAAVDNSKLFETAYVQSQILAQINNSIRINNYYAANIPGGIYKETQVLVDRKIEDNKQALRNGLAQQLLHEEMVGMQYTK